MFLQQEKNLAYQYKVNDLAAIQRNTSKLSSEVFGAYKVWETKRNKLYKIKKARKHEGPNVTTSAEYIKKAMEQY